MIIKTVGEMQDYLKQFDRNLPLKVMKFVNKRPYCSCDCDGGTDMSGDQEFALEVSDFENRIIIEGTD